MTFAKSLRSLSFWVALAIAFSVGAVGGLLTPIGPWYELLEKPAFQPPDWAFGPAWTIIFLLSAYSAHRLWDAAAGKTARRVTIVGLFALNALLNLGWSYLFFFSQRPDLALNEALLLWISVLLIIVIIAGKVPITRWLMAPYLAWVTFAIVLNFYIYRLNMPFA